VLAGFISRTLLADNVYTAYSSDVSPIPVNVTEKRSESNEKARNVSASATWHRGMRRRPNQPKPTGIRTALQWWWLDDWVR